MGVLCWCVYVGAVIALYKLLDYLVRHPRMSGLSERYVLITGCDSGFGFEAVKRLDKEGCHVFATCITERGETQLKKACSNRLHVIHMDITDSQSVKNGFQFVKATLPFGKGLWGLVNNAGIQASATGPCEMLTLDNYRECYDVNVLGMIDVTMTFLPLVKLERGRIVNTSSIGGRIAALPLHAPYNASKYAVEAYSDVLRRNMCWYGVGVYIIEPSNHATNMAQLSVKQNQVCKAWNQATPDVQKQYGPDYQQRVLDWMDQYATGSVEQCLDSVVDAYHHALFAYYPRARYLVGKGATMILLIQALPESIADYIFSTILKTPKPATH